MCQILSLSENTILLETSCEGTIGHSTLTKLTSHMIIVRNLSYTIPRDMSMNFSRMTSNIFEIMHCIDQDVQHSTMEALETKYICSKSLVVN